MARVIHDGKTETKQVYTRPPDTFCCDTCGKDMGTDDGICLNASADYQDMDTMYEIANFCSFFCVFKYHSTEDYKRFERLKRRGDCFHIGMDGFSLNDLKNQILLTPNPNQEKE